MRRTELKKQFRELSSVRSRHHFDAAVVGDAQLYEKGRDAEARPVAAF